MSARARPQAPKEVSTIFDFLPPVPGDAEVSASAKPATIESFSLFVGQQGAGKSSLLTLLQPQGASKDAPKPTVALEYLFARRSRNNTTAKDIAHIWELGGGGNLVELVGVPITKERLGTATLGVVVDLSAQQDVVSVLCHWLKTLRQHVSIALEQLKNGDEHRAKTADRLEKAAKARYAELKPTKKGDKPCEHPDRRAVEPSPVPILIIANKYDAFMDGELKLKKALCQALRFAAHANGATLVFSSAKDKVLQNQFRGLLSYALFHKVDKSARPQYGADKPLYVPAGADTFDSIAKAGPLDLAGLGASCYRGGAKGGAIDPKVADALIAAVAELYGPPTVSYAQREDAATAIDEDAARADDEFAEAAIDEVYREKLKAVARYRQKIEQKEREADKEKQRRAKKATQQRAAK